MVKNLSIARSFNISNMCNGQNRDGGPCLSLELSLNVIDVVEPVTCEQFISASPFPDTTLSHMDFVGGSFSLQCRGTYCIIGHGKVRI